MSNKKCGNTRDEWNKIVAEFKVSGKTQTEWCKGNNIGLRRFNYWFCKLKNDIKTEDKAANWVVLNREINFENSKMSLINIKIGNAIIEINSEFNYEHLLKVVKVLNTIC